MNNATKFSVVAVSFCIILSLISPASAQASYVGVKQGDAYKYEEFQQISNASRIFGWISVLEDRTIAAIGAEIAGNSSVTCNVVHHDRLVSVNYISEVGPIPPMPADGIEIVNVTSTATGHLSTPVPVLWYFINKNAPSKTWTYFKNESTTKNLTTTITERWDTNGVLELFENSTFNNATNITNTYRVAKLVENVLPGYDTTIMMVSGSLITCVIVVATRKKMMSKEH
nr:hypothetical protein [Candidatus Sigynarchaeum springense]